jgi:uncharacterized protein YgfB (UPF0149 family)
VTAGPPITPQEYESLRESLLEAGTMLALPELHGGVSGALCAGGPAAAERWLDGLFADNHASNLAAVRHSLHELVQATWRMLGGGDLAFELVLPDEDAPLEDQVQALALWCHGFLAGLATNAPELASTRAPTSEDQSGEVAEILADFAEISRAGVGEDDAADRDQAGFALAEIKEYARVSAQIVFEDLAERRATAAREVH